MQVPHEGFFSQLLCAEGANKPARKRRRKREEKSEKKRKRGGRFHFLFDHDRKTIVASSVPRLSRSIMDTNDPPCVACRIHSYIAFHCGDFAAQSSVLQKSRPATNQIKNERWCHHPPNHQYSSQHTTYSAAYSRFRKGADARSAGGQLFAILSMYNATIGNDAIATKLQLVALLHEHPSRNQYVKIKPQFYTTIEWSIVGVV